MALADNTGLGRNPSHWAGDPDPLAFQQAAGGVQETRAVINDETAQRRRATR
jgi:hypothetical protein